MGRTLAEHLAPRLGSIVVENRAGAAGLIASEFVKNAAPDGYTLLVHSDNPVLSRALGLYPQFNILTDLTPAVLIATVDFFLVVNMEAVPVASPRDLIRIAKERPRSLSYASPGSGSPHHLGMELLKQQTGVDLVHVPYKGLGPAMPDVLAGRVQVVMTGFPAVASHMKSGKLRLLASAGPARSPLQPDLPTLRELGIPNVEVEGYFHLMAPPNTPAAVVSRLNAEANQVLAMPQVKSDLTKRAVTAAGGTPKQLHDKLELEMAKWTKVVRTAGIKPE